MPNPTTSTAAAAPPAAPLPLSIRLLRRMRPLVVAVLGSPLHGLLSRDLLVLAYRGRRSGRRYEVPLSYARRGERLYLCTRSSGWWRGVSDGAAIELRLRGRTVEAPARVLDPSSEEALAGFRAFLTRNPRTGEMLYDVGCDDKRRPLEADLRREVQRSVVVRVDLPPA